MLRILGPGKSLSGGMGRRELLRIGGLAGCGLSLTGWQRERPLAAAENSATGPAFGKARSCILLYIYGAWSQLDTFDPKPNAPAEIRGEFGSIASAVPGLRVCEHLPLTAQILDRCTVVRSMSHPNPIHNAAYTLTGNPETTNLEGRQRHPDHWPYFGGVLDYLDGRSNREREAGRVPVNVGLPWVQSSRSMPNKRAGTFGGFLGASYDPLWAEFTGAAPLEDPYRAITPDGTFSLIRDDASGATLDLLDRRHSLLSQLDRNVGAIGDSTAARHWDRNRARAFDLAASTKVRDALAVSSEPPALRERYGMNLFGQSCLCARRLVERGVRLATVVWDEWQRSDESWDTHFDHHPRMKGFLLPGFDRAYSALLTDLEERGLLDETLVLCLSEHGRTPRFYEISQGIGRGHWSEVYSQVFAGAGIRRGHVIGSSDAIAAAPRENPLSPKDILATAYHLLGIDPRTEIPDRQGRLWPLVHGGRMVSEMLA